MAGWGVSLALGGGMGLPGVSLGVGVSDGTTTGGRRVWVGVRSTRVLLGVGVARVAVKLGSGLIPASRVSVGLGVE